ncbi:Glutathione-binding protein GsiB [Anaerolineae bacterium]|nr:Glutathione-binding protein GsiB [Anaerolineae bacterium]
MYHFLLALLLFGLVACGQVPTPTIVLQPTSAPAATQIQAATQPPVATKAPAATQPLVATSAPAATATKAPVTGGTITVGYDIEPESLDIQINERHQLPTIMRNVFDTLLVKAADGTFKPSLAMSWDIAPDGRTYTFKLRQGVKFHDGTPFNAAAVKFTFERILDPATESRWANQLIAPYDFSEVVDDYTFRVKLKDSYGPFLEALAQTYLGIVSPTTVKKWGRDYAYHQVGTGPFIFKEYVPKDHLTLERNPDYNWAPAIYQHQGPPHVDRIIFKFIPESVTRLGTVETGETNVIHTFAPTDLPVIRKNSNLQVYINSRAGRARHYTLNVQNEPTNELAVRQAMNMALDRPTIAKTLFGEVNIPAFAHFAPSTLYYSDSLEKEYAQKNAYDPTKAAKLLDDAGWTMGTDGIRRKGGKSLKLVLVSASQQQVHELIQAQLKKLGFEVQIQMMAAPAFFAACGKGDDNLCFLGGMTSPDPGLWMNGYFAIGGTYNWSMHKNTQLNTLLNDGLKTAEPAKRQDIYLQAQRIIIDEALTLPVFYERDTYVTRSEVKNLTFDAFSDPVLYDAYIQK